MSDILIRFENVHKTYHMGTQEVCALNEISISFARGSFWAVMGASGSGKSTMLNLIGCLDRPTSGIYTFNDKNIALLDDNELSEIRLQNIGFIFQSFNLIPQLSVQENIELPMFYLGYSAQKSSEKAMELAELVGLSNRLNHRPAELSGGQQQRVAIARALANDPQVILADEPTGNLDTATGKQIIDLIIQLNRQGRTIIVVTHEEDIAVRARNRLHMRDGKIDKVEENTQ